MLQWAHQYQIYTITLCHGPGALLSTTLNGQEFIYAGYKTAVFPDSVDKQTQWWAIYPALCHGTLSGTLEGLGMTLANTKADDTCCIDRELITGAKPFGMQK